MNATIALAPAAGRRPRPASVLAAAALALAAFLGPRAAAAAAPYYLKPIETVGATPDEKAALDALLASAVAKHAQTAPSSTPDGAAASLEPRLVKLGRAYVLTLVKKRKDGTTFAQQARASDADELDLATDRLVRAVLADVPIEQAARVSDVTAQEAARRALRTDVVRQWVFGLGPSLGRNLNSTDIGVSWALGYSFGLSPNFSARAGLDFGSFNQGNSSYWNFALGGDWFPDEEASGPFVSGEFGYGRSRSSETSPQNRDEVVRGFTIGAGAGYRFARTSKVNLGVTFKYVTWTERNSAGVPGVGIGTLALYF